MAKSTKSIDKEFVKRLEPIESTFTSFRDLHGIYVGVLKHANINPNSRLAFERAKKSADERQNEMSQQLYTQGYIVLTGIAEALLKDVFDSLIVQNFTELRNAKDENFTAMEVQKILINAKEGFDDLYHLSAAFGRLVRDRLHNRKASGEKINLQNINKTVYLFDYYFNIKIGSPDLVKLLDRSWQIRHCLVHSNGEIDTNFMENVGSIGMLKQEEKKGVKLELARKDYIHVKDNFMNLFTHLNELILESGLESRYVKGSGL